MSTDLEKTNLEAHVDLCQQRYQELERRLSRVEWRLDNIENMLQEIKAGIFEAHKAEKSHLLTVAGAIITVLLGVIGWGFSRLLH
jgi:chaperonin cofactor prefoldin